MNMPSITEQIEATRKDILTERERRFWEQAYCAEIQATDKQPVKAAEYADEALAEWRKRWGA